MAKRASKAKVKARKVKAKRVKAKKATAKKVSRSVRIPVMAASAPPGPGPLYPCRCFKVGNKYEKYVLDPATGTYQGPTECTRDECRACNQSKAVVIR